MSYYLGGVHATRLLLERFPSHVGDLYVNHMDKPVLVDIINIAKQLGIRVHKVNQPFFDQYLSGVSCQGVGVYCQQLPTLGLDNVLSRLEGQSKWPLVLILDRIQDPHNLGACLRTAAAFSADAVIVSKHHSVGLTPTVVKVSCGGACVVPLVVEVNLKRTIEKLKKNGFWIYGASERGDRVLHTVDSKVPVAWVMGNEAQGVSTQLLAACDQTYAIDVSGGFSTLNVSVATGICLYQTYSSRLI